MFRSQTLFIVGAGASTEIGLSSSAELKDVIARKLDIEYEIFGRVEKGDRPIAEALKAAAQSETPPLKNLGPYQDACRLICRAMPLLGSIDDCIDSHRRNTRVSACGKLAIARSILEGEKSSKLYVNPGANRGLDFKNLESTWYSRMFRLATTGVPIEDIEKAFANVSFITFNYDRCIEHFLQMALRKGLGLDSARSEAIVRGMTILHPYGVVGNLPWMAGATAVPFGSQDHDRPAELISIANQVKTYTEQIHDEDERTMLRSAVQRADIIVFLGFAYHRQNMLLLAPEGECKARRVLATGLGFSEPDRILIKSDLSNWLNKPSDTISVDAIACSKLFEEYWRTLQAA